MFKCSILFVRHLISSPFKLFKSLIVSFPTSIGLKIGQFLAKFLLRNWGVVIWGVSSLFSILSSWDERVPKIWLVKLFCYWRLLQSFKVVVLPSLSFKFIVLKGETTISVFWAIMVISSKGGWFEIIVLFDVVFQAWPFWNILTSRKGYSILLFEVYISKYVNIGISILFFSIHLYHSSLKASLEKNHFLFWSFFGRWSSFLRYCLSILKGPELSITINWLGSSCIIWERVGQVGGDSWVIYLGWGMLGVKSTLSSLIEDLRELISKDSLGEEEVLIPWVEIILLDHSRLENCNATFPLSSCMIS